MRRFQDCIFDLYGTLADIRTDERSPELWQAMARWYGRHGAHWQPQAMQERYFSLVRELEQAALEADRNVPGACPEIRIEPVFQRLFLDKGVRPEPERIDEAGQYFRRRSRRFIRLYDGAPELLRALREGGQRVWLLSNAQRLFTMPELEALGLLPYFDGVYLSSDCGCKKPDPRFFQKLLTERGIRPESAVMIGNDGACDIRGARAAGLAAMYIRSAISPEEPLPDADFVLERMDLALARRLLTQQENRA